MNIRASIITILISVTTLSTAMAQTRVVIGTAGTTGALYPMGVAMAETLNRHSKSIKASAESTAGSLENIRLLDYGELQWGIVANDMAYQAYTGTGAYEGKQVKSLQGLFGTVASYVQVFAAADSNVNEIADFRGKRIGVGAPGSGGERTAKSLLEFYGLTYNDIKPFFMENADMTSALKDGQLDGFIITHPLRSASLLEMTTTLNSKLIPISDSEFYEKYPYFSKSSIPAGTYNGIDSAVDLPVSRIVMYTTESSGLTDEQVYEMLSTIWENAVEWQAVHAAVKANVTLKQAMVGLDGIPLHPAAQHFFAEKGLALPE